MEYLFYYIKVKLLNFHSFVFFLAGWPLSYFVPIMPVVFGVFMLSIADFFLGYNAAKWKIKKYEGKRKTLPKDEFSRLQKPAAITSDRMWTTAQKIGFYIVSILGVHAFEIIWVHPYISLSIPLTYMISLPFAMAELRSIDKNTYIVTGTSFWKFIPFFGSKILEQYHELEKRKDDNNNSSKK